MGCPPPLACVWRRPFGAAFFLWCRLWCEGALFLFVFVSRFEGGILDSGTTFLLLNCLQTRRRSPIAFCIFFLRAVRPPFFLLDFRGGGGDMFY
jgi:hypothetical protein